LALAALALVVFDAYDNYQAYHYVGQVSGYELWRLQLFSFGGFGLALAALALMTATHFCLLQKKIV